MPQRPTSEELAALREELSSVDRALLEVVARRSRCVAEIAAFKAREDVPALDRARETDHLESMLARGAELGLVEDLVRPLFEALFAASRAEQRHVRLAALAPLRVGIVGATAGIGATLARVFTRAGLVVEGTGLDAGAPAGEIAARSELVVLAAPIDVTCAVAAQVGPHVVPGACLMDVTSVKRAPIAAMLAATSPEVDVVGAHPLFGPSAAPDLEGRRVVLCRGRGDVWMPRVARLFELLGAEVVEADAEEHDHHMAFGQALTQAKAIALGATLARSGVSLARARALSTETSRADLSTLERLAAQRPGLFADLLCENPEAPSACAALAQELAALAREAAAHDRDALIRQFMAVARVVLGGA